MRLFAFAALLALPLLGLGGQSASADYYCCGKERYPTEGKVYWTYVARDAAVFDCDSRDCQTKMKVYAGTKVKVYCRNGWCEIKNFPFANVWVLEECLKQSYDEGYREDNGYERNGYDNGIGDEGENGDGYRREYRKY